MKIAVLSVSAALVCAGVFAEAPRTVAPPWDFAALARAPRVFDAGEYATNTPVKAVFYEGVPYKGRPTRVFAYIGFPGNIAPGRKVPAMVLVHGGLGSAFHRWVRLWNARGYAAVSMDTCGCVSGNVFGDEQRKHKRHAWAGPAGWGGFDAIEAPVEDQWAYHAVAAVTLGHSLLRADPRVDPARVGITGVSWGGWLTCLAAAFDHRYAFAAPVYGCGFMDTGITSEPYENRFRKAGGKMRIWCDRWEPSRHLARAECPFLWIDSSNDKFFPLDAVAKSARATGAPFTLATRYRMAHNHSAVSEAAPELLAFADSLFLGAPALPKWFGCAVKDRAVTASFAADPRRPVVRAWLVTTPDGGRWYERVWTRAPAELTSFTVTCRLPDTARAWYLELETDGDCHVTTPVTERTP